MLTALRRALEKRRIRQLVRRYPVGSVHIRFVAKDIRREIRVTDASEIADGFLTVETLTRNVLYEAKLGEEPQPFSEPQRMAILEIWSWNGPSWGGPVDRDQSGG